MTRVLLARQTEGERNLELGERVATEWNMMKAMPSLKAHWLQVSRGVCSVLRDHGTTILNVLTELQAV